MLLVSNCIILSFWGQSFELTSFYCILLIYIFWMVFKMCSHFLLSTTTTPYELIYKHFFHEISSFSDSIHNSFHVFPSCDRNFCHNWNAGPKMFSLFGLEWFYIVYFNCNTVYGICKTYQHILDHLLCSCVWIMWCFTKHCKYKLPAIFSGYNLPIYYIWKVEYYVSIK